MREQIDRMKRKKASDDYEYSGSEEDPSLEQPTIKKHGAGGGALSPTTSGTSIGEEEDDEEEDEFGGQETLVTGRGAPQGEFSDQDTMIIREGQAQVRGVMRGGALTCSWTVVYPRVEPHLHQAFNLDWSQIS